jgi:tetratricopeptide (TPR) repeat protein
MKYLIFTIACFFSLSLNASDKADSLFTLGNEYYQSGDYEKAIATYLKVDSIGLYSPELYFNLGNAYFRSNKLGKARIYLERAALANPSDEDYIANLDYLKSMLTDKFNEVPELFLKTWLRDLVNFMNTDGWLKLSLIFFLICLSGVVLYLFFYNAVLRKAGFFGGILFLLLSIVALLFSIKQNQRQFHTHHAIIMEGSQSVRSAPRESGKDLFLLHEGSKVKLEKEVDEWVEIRVSDGRKGWIPIKAVEEI